MGKNKNKVTERGRLSFSTFFKIETSLDGRVTIMKQKKFYSENGLLIFIWFRRNCKRFDAVVVPWVTGKWNS